ncbi:MAG: hypothetical protein KME42_08475 [Tildeniella nuda ZEHNDER 1965/U140]|jgi:acetylornithine/succinyldiaminopimelate/putrescine aminotransferase|nr:hypothetical protein [Tildeniella nuda ZEHNDER 1965/U140]
MLVRIPFEVIHQPTFGNQPVAIFKEQAIQILEKTKILQNDSKPHSSLKKKLLYG